MKRVILLMASLFAVGCATTQKNSGGTFKSEYEVVDMGDISKRKCNWNKKTQAITQLDDLMGVANACVKSGQWTTVNKVGQKILHLHSAAPWGAYYLALEAEQRGAYHRAHWMLDLALKKSPNLSVLVYQKGRVLWALDEHNEAVDLIAKAVAMDKNLLDGQLFLADIYFRDEQNDKAKDHYEAALKIDSDNYRALVGMSEVMLKGNDFKIAESYLKKVLSENSKNLTARIKLAQLYELRLMNLDEALSTYKKAVRYHGNDNILKETGVDAELKAREIKKLIAKKEAEQKRTVSSEKSKQGVKK